MCAKKRTARENSKENQDKYINFVYTDTQKSDQSGLSHV